MITLISFFKVMVLISITFLLGSCNDSGSSSQSNAFVKFSKSKNLAVDFKQPPYSAKPWAFWWWLEGNISREGIVRDLKAMKKVGIGGAIIYDAGSSSYKDVKRTEPGPSFMSTQSKGLFAYAAKVADSLGLGLSMNITSGWNDGGPWVTPKMAAKKIAWSSETVKGPAKIDKKLTLPDDLLHDPKSSAPYYEPVAVIAVKQDSSYKNITPLENFELKAAHRLTHRKYPEKGGYDWDKYLEEDTLAADQGYDAQMKDIINITDKVDSTGHISWDAPQGTYTIYRFVSTGTGAKVSTHSPGGGGLAIDYMDADAMDLQFNHTIGQILPMVKPYIGSGLRYLHDDSWELGMANWSADFVSKFKNQHGYDPVPYLPILTGKIIQNRDVSNRFLYDYRRTIADLIAKKDDPQKWQQAADAAQDIMDMNKYQLYPDYKTLFLTPYDNPEIIFERVYTFANRHLPLEIANGPNGYGGWAGNTPLQNLVDDYEMANGLPKSDPNSGYDPQHPYQNRDPRFYDTILYNDASYRGRDVETFVPGGKDSPDGSQPWNTSKTGYYLRKFINPDLPITNPWNDQSTQPWIYIRYAEVLLNYAEAENEASGPDQSVYNAINKIRERAGMPDLPEGLSKNEMRDRIRNERRVELAFEEHRFYDVRRWKIAMQKANEPAYGMEITKQDDGTLKYERKVALEGRSFQEKNYWLPIPRREIQASDGKLDQNPGY